MSHDGTGTGWDVTSPANSEPRRLGAQEIRDLRKAVGIRQDKEHVAAGASSAGGEHKAGSAKVYYAAAASPPATRPDGTAFTSADYGRPWYQTDTGKIAILTNHSPVTWTQIKAGDFVAASILTAALADGILSADATGRAKMADGYVTLAKVAGAIFTADATGRGKFASGFVDSTLLAAGAALANLASGSVTLAKLESAVQTLLLVRVKSGGYTGNGTSQGVTTSFVPHLILIWNTTDDQLYIASGHSTGKCTRIADSSNVAGGITSDATTFTVTGVLNTSGKSFLYFALSNNA